MAYTNQPDVFPLLLTYESDSSYIHCHSQGCTLFMNNRSNPVYRIQEPLLRAHGIMTDSTTVHLVLLKKNGDLCYTLVSSGRTPQTALIAKLDVRNMRYRKFFLFPQGNKTHIFYASSHQCNPELWRIEHHFWNGTSWKGTRLGEIVHSQEPLYHVSLDTQGNLHLCTLTSLGQTSVIYENRFNSTFHLWGSPVEILKFPGKVTCFTALMTTNNVRYLFWITQSSAESYRVCFAHQSNAHELTGLQKISVDSVKNLNSPCKALGAIELNGNVWLMIHSENELLLQKKGDSWKQVASHPSLNSPLKWIHKSNSSIHHFDWLQENTQHRSPAFCHELGLSFPGQIPTPTPSDIPPAVPAFSPVGLSPDYDPLQSISVRKKAPSDTTPPIASLDDRILNNTEPASETPPREPTSSPSPHPLSVSELTNISNKSDSDTSEKLLSLIEAVAQLEKETRGLRQLLDVLLEKQDKNGSTLEKLEAHISRIQTEKSETNAKGGFWNKWMT